ncbi:MAG: YbgC/FadM family acyl-CoA thioesterase [Bacteroidetes bacterium]|nr:YbgC/FadM family acyl-CoA thioesterase [Bacteroidota bacterium]
MSRKKTTIQLKVNYHQVDQMGIVHHAQYAYFLEQARIDWLHKQGVSYAALEQDGILLPLTDISIQYKRPLRFDETFFVHSDFDIVDNYFINFKYLIENVENTKIATATTRLVFVEKQSMRAMKCPEFLVEKLTF